MPPSTPTAAAPEEAASPSQSQPREEAARARRRRIPLFSEVQETTAAPVDPGPLSLGPTMGREAGPGFESASEPDEDNRESAAPRGSQPPGSSPGSTPRAFARKEIAGAIEAGIVGVSVLVHENLARDQLDEDFRVYIVEDEEAQRLSKPLASIASRHLGTGAGAANPDLADAIAAAIQLAVYVARQLKLRATIRRLRRGTVPEEHLAEQPGTPA